MREPKTLIMAHQKIRRSIFIAEIDQFLAPVDLTIFNGGGYEVETGLAGKPSI
jgi:hypothetical protein